MIRKFARRPALAAPAIALLLAACGGGEDAPAADDAEDAGPQGEVLGGTIGDDIIDGLNGDNTIYGGAGDDLVILDDGDNQIHVGFDGP